MAGLTWPNTNCWSSKLPATRLVVGGLSMTLPSGRMRRQLVHLTGQEWIWTYTIFTCAHQLPPHHYHRPLAGPYRSLLLKEAVPVPRTVIHGTEVSAFGLLEIAAFATRATHVTEITLGSAVHSIPLAPSVPAPPPPPREGSPERVQMPTMFPVHSVYNVPVASDQLHGLPCSVTLFCSSSVDSSGTSVPVRSFSPLVPVHLVSLLQLFQFQVELADYPDQAAAAYVLNGLRDGFQVGFETLSVSLWSSSSTCAPPLITRRHRCLPREWSFMWAGCRSFPLTTFYRFAYQPFGVVPKNNQPGKWHLILDLSSPDGHSVNDSIPKSPLDLRPLPGFGVGSSSPWLPGHLTSMCDSGIKFSQPSQGCQ